MILILNMNKELVTLSFKIFSTVENQLQISSIMQKNISFQYIFLNETLNEIENLNPVDVPPVLKKDNVTDKKDRNTSVFFQ